MICSYLTGFKANGSWTVPESGWYRILVWGKSGNGSRGGSYSFSKTAGIYGGGGGSGGSAGGFAASLFYLEKGTVIPITISTTITRFDSANSEQTLHATAGSDGGTPDSFGNGGNSDNGGMGYGGNIVNLEGTKGGNGGNGIRYLWPTGGSNYGASAGFQGGNLGASAGTRSINGWGGGSGAGGARLPGQDYCDYIATDMSTKYSGGKGGENLGSGSMNGGTGSSMPAITLSADVKLYGGGCGGGGAGGDQADGTASGSYGAGGTGQSGVIIIETVIYPPTIPGPITYGKIKAAREVIITCGESTHPEGKAISYVWERRVDTGVWTQIAITDAPEATDTVPTSGMRYQVRVKAADTAGNESAYSIGEAVTINYNDPPVIADDVDSDDLGDLTASGLSYSYTVTDDKDAEVAIEIAVDGKVRRSLTVPVDELQTFTLTDEEWQQVLNGDHTLTVTGTDADGESTVRTVTFSRDQRVIELRLRQPKTTAERVRRVFLALSAALPPGHLLTVLASNNALDESPAWEDITQAVQSGRAHIFENEEKTATEWALDIHLTLDRGTAAASCHISGMSVGYDTEGGSAAQMAALSVQNLALTEMMVDQEYRMLLLELGVM